MLLELRTIFFVYGPWIIILPMFLTLRSIKDESSKIRILTLYLMLSMLALVTSFVFWKKSINNLPITHVFTLVEFLLLLWFFSKLLTGFISKRIFLLLGIFFLFFSLIDSFFLEDIYSFNSLGRSVEALIFIVLSFCWFLKLLKGEQSSSSSESEGISYIVAGFFIYFSGSVMLFSFSNYINEMTHSLSLNIWSIHTFLLVIMYLALTLGLIKYQAK